MPVAEIVWVVVPAIDECLGMAFGRTAVALSAFPNKLSGRSRL